ncbi:hypothetical protein C8N37_105219 [Sphingobacterium faecium]|nr:hypothetical protein C8N37_105219 [Sphingobacterium faecium]
MFDFWKFFKGLFSRDHHFDNYWDKFPERQHLQLNKKHFLY